MPFFRAQWVLKWIQRPSICSCSFHIRNILSPETLYPYCRLWLSSLLVVKQHKVTKFLHHILSCTHQTHLWKKEKFGMSLTNSTRLHVSFIIVNPQFRLGNFQDIFFWKMWWSLVWLCHCLQRGAGSRQKGLAVRLLETERVPFHRQLL